MKLTVIADDFTGANDVGINLKKYGLNVVSVIDRISEGADVNILNTESRNLPSDKAYQRLKDLFKDIDLQRVEKFYKKIDSTLRGNISREVEVLIEEKARKNDEKIIPIIVGFPRMKRKIINGIHYLDKKRLCETEFAHDPGNPVKEDDLKMIFPKAEHINLEKIRGDLETSLKGLKKKLVIFDTETEEDLKKIAYTLVKNNQDKYIVGSAGIMQYLPNYWNLFKRRTIIISGSASETNIKQLDTFLAQKKEEFKIFNLDVFNKDDNIKISQDNNQDIIIKSAITKKEVGNVLEKYSREGYINQEATEIISTYISQKSIEIIKKEDIRNIIITGGEIAHKVLQALNIKGLNIQSEIQTGIPLCKSLDFKYNIITKPGGFGDQSIYFSAYEKIKTVDK